MKLKHLKLKFGLSIIVLLLSLLTGVAITAGWYSQEQSRLELDAMVAVGVDAGRDVKNAYIDALQALNQIDAAIKVDDIARRSRDLAKADEWLQSSRQRFNHFSSAWNQAGFTGEASRQSLNDAFANFWGRIDELRNLAQRRDDPAYERMKEGPLRAAAQAMLAAFSSFDVHMQAESEAIMAGFDKRFGESLYVFGALIALTILLAASAYLTLSRIVWRPLERAGAYFDSIASGDLTQRIDAGGGNEIGVLYMALGRMQGSLARIVGAVRAGMDSIDAGSLRIAAGNTELSSRIEEQAAALRQTAASLDQLSGTVKQNADNARQANQLAATASDVARRGGGAVGEVVATMQEISTSSRKISDIVGVIDSIAFQTNILALNAAVEAARAGEQGKGFAVVAAEVRALAQRSAQAAREIKGLIDDSTKKVANGSSQVEQAGATMQEIVASVARVTDIMGEISAASSEQSTGIGQINIAVAQMDHVTRENSVLIGQAAAAASELREQVQQVVEAVSVFRLVDRRVVDMEAESGQAAAIMHAPSAGGDASAAVLATSACPGVAPGDLAGTRDDAAASTPGGAPGRQSGGKPQDPGPKGSVRASRGMALPGAALAAVPALPYGADVRAGDDDWEEF